MQISENVSEILELQKTLLPFRENLRGRLGNFILASLKPAENFELLKKREKLLREWLDLTDHNGEFNFNAAVEPVSPLFEGAKRSGILSGEELLKVKSLLNTARNIRENLSCENHQSIEDLKHGIRDFSTEIEWDEKTY